METEDQSAVEAVLKPKRDKKSAVFARPVFAQELFTEENKKRFDERPAWQRHLIKRVIDHGDLSRAAQEAGVSTYVKKEIDHKIGDEKTIRQALLDGGITTDSLVHHLLDCLEAKTIRFDKHQNPIYCTDHNLKLKTIELITKLRGDLIQITKKQGPDTQGIVDLFESTDPDGK